MENRKKMKPYFLIAGSVLCLFGFLFACLGVFGADRLIGSDIIQNSETQTLFTVYFAFICTALEITGITLLLVGAKQTKSP